METISRSQIAVFQAPLLYKSLMQIVTSFGGFIATCAAMYILTDVSYLLALAFAPLAAGFLVRIFIIQHDCGHRAFFRSRHANNLLGFVCSLVTLTPFTGWRRQHAQHHGSWNDLDRKDTGVDIYSTCLTVAEYRALSWFARLQYRVTRHPLVANIVLPPLIFLILYRVPFDMPRTWQNERRVVHLTSLVVLGTLAGLGLLLSFGDVALVQISVVALAAIVGVWLFSVQHRGRDIQWVRHAAWNHTAASLESTNFLKLPRLFQWFTGNIGFHHVHHLNARIPNYRLQECHDAIPVMQKVRPVSFFDGLRAVGYVLWDEDGGRMMTFREAART